MIGKNIDSTKYILLMIVDEIQGILPSTVIVWIAINCPFILKIEIFKMIRNLT